MNIERGLGGSEKNRTEVEQKAGLLMSVTTYHLSFSC